MPRASPEKQCRGREIHHTTPRRSCVSPSNRTLSDPSPCVQHGPLKHVARWRRTRRRGGRAARLRAGSGRVRGGRGPRHGAGGARRGPARRALERQVPRLRPASHPHPQGQAPPVSTTATAANFYRCFFVGLKLHDAQRVTITTHKRFCIFFLWKKVQVHLDYLEAGADVIISASYQVRRPWRVLSSIVHCYLSCARARV